MAITQCCTFLAATIAVVTNDGRNIVGVLRGYDQATNLILDECHERVYSMQACDSGLPTRRHLMAVETLTDAGSNTRLACSLPARAAFDDAKQCPG